MVILVTGGFGFIGQNLVKRLLEEGNEVIIFGRYRKDKLIEDSKCRYIFDDFFNINKYRDDFQNVNIVYHLLSTTNPKSSNENIEYDIQSNVINTVKLLDLCIDCNIERFIYTSSGGTVYGIPQHEGPIKEDTLTKPICSYGISKVAIENYIYMYSHLFGLKYQILRISNPYGPYQNPFSQQGAIAVFLGKIYEKEDIQIWGNGTTYRDYIYIDDVVEALYLSMITSNYNNILNIGSGKKYSLNEIIKTISIILNKEINVNYTDFRKLDAPGNYLDIKKASEILNWYPKYSIENGIEMTWNWITTNFQGK